MVYPTGRRAVDVRDFQSLEPPSTSSLLAGSIVLARVALINSYDSRWSVQWQRHHRDFDYVAHFNHYYRPLAAKNIRIEDAVAGVEAARRAGMKCIAVTTTKPAYTLKATDVFIERLDALPVDTFQRLTGAL